MCFMGGKVSPYHLTQTRASSVNAWRIATFPDWEGYNMVEVILEWLRVLPDSAKPHPSMRLRIDTFPQWGRL
jgi:hypothetical protein